MPVTKPVLPPAYDARKVKRAVEGLPIDDAVESATEVFQALANPNRIRIMHALAHDEMSVGDLARALGLSMSALSHQLAMLRLLRLVAAREEGRQTFYRVIDHFVGDLVHACLAHIEQGTGPTGRHRHPHRRRS